MITRKIIEKLREKYLRFLKKYYWLTLAIYILISIFLGYHAMNIGLKTDILDLLPDKNVNVQNLHKVIEYYGGEGYLIGIVEWNNNYQQILEDLRKTKNDTSNIRKELQNAISQNNYKWFQEKELSANGNDPNNSKTGKEKIADLIEEYKKINQSLQYFIPKQIGTENFNQLILNQITNPKDKNFLESAYTLNGNKKSRILNDSIEDNDKLRIVQILTSIHFKLDYIPSLKKQFEIILQETIEKADLASKQPDNTAVLLDLIDVLDANMTDLKQDYDTILKDKGGKKPLIEIADRLADKLGKEKDLVKFIEYKFKTNFIKDNLLYLININDLKDIKERIQNKISYERRKKLLSSSLFVDQPVSLDFSDIQDKNAKSTKVIKLGKKTDIFEKSPEDYDYYMNEDENMMLLLVKPEKSSIDLGFAEKLTDKSKEIADTILKDPIIPSQIQIGFTGRYVKKVEDARVIDSDLKVISIIAIFMILLAVYAQFRTFRAVIVVGSTLVSALIWSTGIVALTIGYFNIISGFLLAILTGLGSNFGINIFNRYLEEREKGADCFQALDTTYRTTLMANITATLTTAAAFAVLGLSSFKGFAQFGLTAALGLILLFADVLLSYSSVIIFSEKLVPLKIRQKTLIRRDHLRGKRFPFYRPILMVAIVLSVISVIGIFNIKFNANFYDLAAQNTNGRILEQKADKYLQMTLWPVMIYTPDLETMKRTTKIINQLKDEGKLDTLDKVDSLCNYLPEDQVEKRAIMLEIKDLMRDSILSKLKDPEEKKKVKRLKEIVNSPYITEESIPKELKRQFKGNREGYFIFYYPKLGISMSKPKNLERIAGQLNLIDSEVKKESQNHQVTIGSDSVIFNDVLHMIKTESPIILIVLMLIIIYLLWSDFKSTRLINRVMVNLFFSILFLFGGLFLLGWELNYFNIIMFPILLGSSIDYGVYYYHRYMEEGPHNILFISMVQGKATFLCGFTDLIGFGSLIFALYRGLATIGEVAMLGVTLCVIVDIVLFSCILEFRKDWRNVGLKNAILGKINSQAKK